jgi:hypothetical protein
MKDDSERSLCHQGAWGDSMRTIYGRAFWIGEGASDADGIEAGRPEFEIEGPAVDFALGGNRIVFVNGKMFETLPVESNPLW